MAIPDDIFTEPETSILTRWPIWGRCAIWPASGKGAVASTSRRRSGPERRAYYERIEMQPIDPQANGPQLLYGLRYHQHINTVEEDITFHDQVGFWLWEPATGLIMQTLAIPRGQIAMASGHAGKDDTRLSLSAERGRTDYGICSTTFLEEAFRTDRYQIDVTFNADGSWSYISDTTLVVRGKEPFAHRDRNKLVKVGEADLNPWLSIIRGGAKP
jgi:hypothetical protein